MRSTGSRASPPACAGPDGTTGERSLCSGCSSKGAAPQSAQPPRITDERRCLGAARSQAARHDQVFDALRPGAQTAVLPEGHHGTPRRGTVTAITKAAGLWITYNGVTLPKTLAGR